MTAARNQVTSNGLMWLKLLVAATLLRSPLHSPLSISSNNGLSGCRHKESTFILSEREDHFLIVWSDLIRFCHRLCLLPLTHIRAMGGREGNGVSRLAAASWICCEANLWGKLLKKKNMARQSQERIQFGYFLGWKQFSPQDRNIIPWTCPYFHSLTYMLLVLKKEART